MTYKQHLDELWIAAGQKTGERDYWLKKLSGEPVKCGFPVDYRDPPVDAKARERLDFRLSEELATKLMKLSGGSDVRLYIILTTGLTLLLHKYTGSDDIIVGSPILNPEVESEFINTVLILRNRLREDMNFRELLLQVKETVVEAGENCNYPIEVLIEQLDMSGGEDYFPLFDVALMLQNIQDKKYIGHLGLNMIFSFLRTAARIEGQVEYNPSLYKRSTMECAAAHFQNLLNAALTDTTCGIFDIDMLSPEEKQKLLFEFNDTGTVHQKDKTLQRLFEEQVEKTPDNPAVVGYPAGQEERVSLTYKQLNEDSGKLARHLIRQGVNANDLIAILVDRSVEMLIGILGILKSGCGYVPLNPTAPAERTGYMMRECAVRHLLSTRGLIEEVEKVVNLQFETTFIDDVNRRVGARRAVPLSTITALSAEEIAYVIFTSGSTGKPKGVPITHANLSPLLHWGYRELGIGAGDRTIQNLSYYFDWSVWEIFITLTTGACLYPVSSGILLNPDASIDFITGNRITVLHVTPTQYRYFVDREKRLDTLKYLFIGAEKLDYDLTQRSLTSVGGNCRVFNMYGPTEATIIAAVLEIDRDKCGNFEGLSSVPIGGPVGNTDLYILDKHGMAVPVNVTGELVIGGDGIARGYLNNPELTHEKFLRSFFQKATPRRATGGKLYKTGDLARWLPVGIIEFIGRIDTQVKIRGFRIELGEIETRVLEHKDVNSVVVVVRQYKNGENYLCAYIILGREGAERAANIAGDLREFLSGKLPDYMIPNYFVTIGRMPLNPNGKVDTKALPVPDIGASGRRYAAPGDEAEKKLAAIWSGVLGITGSDSQVGIDDNFFEMGGHSLKATTLVYNVYKEFGVNIEIDEVFSNPTIRELARRIKKLDSREYIGITPVEKKEYYKLSYAQRRLWVLCQFEEDSTAYNMPSALILTGNFDLRAFSRAVQILSERHDSLRTVFILIDGEPKQKVIAAHEFKAGFEEDDLRRFDKGQREQAAREIYTRVANRAFNLEQGPLFRFHILRVEEEKYLLFYNIHHIINDGWSQGNINNEIVFLYNFFLKKRESSLPLLYLQYKDYTLWHNDLIESGSFFKSRQYWLEKFADRPNGIELPLDHSRKPVQTFNGGRVVFTIDETMTSGLHRLSLDEDATFFMTLLTLTDIFLSKYAGQEDIIVGAPIAARKRPELYPLVGFLVNTLVYRSRVKAGDSFIDLLSAVKKETLACFENQDYPFDLMIEELGLDRDLSQSPIFNVMLAHNNADTENIDLVMEGIAASDYPFQEDFNMSKFDLIFFMDERADRVLVRIEYNSDLFERETIERMADNFLVFAGDVIENKNNPTANLNYIKEEEYEKVIKTFNDNRHEFPGLSLMELFEEQAAQGPGKIAVVGIAPKGSEAGCPALTYGELNRKANRMARYLREEYGVQAGDVVGISMDRSIVMIIVLLAVVKSGTGYLAVDPTYPRERVLHVLSDSEAKLLIIDKMRPELYAGYKGDILDVGARRENIAKKSPENLEVVNKPSDILYVNYTSGSTGTPNGAMLSHDCLTNLVYWQNEKTSIDCSLRVLQFTSINFCVSFQEIMGTLTNGGELHLIGDVERQDIDYLLDFLSEHQIEILFLPFSYLNFLFNESGRWDRSFNHELKHIITAGEQLKITAGLKRFLDLNPELQLHNHYGSTEMHVVTSYTLDAATADKTPIPPAGKPVSNVDIYILDESLNPTAIGVWGEIFVKGSSEILGYINNDDLTAEKLVRHPEFSADGLRLYRSGDIGRWHEDGDIELRGRKDFQVKIRGFRVEPGEIESRILAISHVRECVVVVKEDAAGQKFLIAYVVIENIERSETAAHDVTKRDSSQTKSSHGDKISINKSLERSETAAHDVTKRDSSQTKSPHGDKIFVHNSIEVGEIIKILGNDLPQYMLPKLVALKNLPLMPNGKVDRDRLPEPEFEKQEDYTAPRDRMEAILVDIWSELLAVEKERIGIDANFFELGGHSLKATLMVSQIQKRFDRRVPLTEIFKAPTIRELAAYIRTMQTEEYAAIEPAQPKDYYPLSSAQKRLFFLHRMEEETIGYNMPVVVVLAGELERDGFVETFRKLIERHESFRTSFHTIGEEPVQRIHAPEDIEFNIEYYEFEKSWTKTFDEGQEPGPVGDAYMRPSDQERRGEPGVPPHNHAEIIDSFIRPFDLSAAPLLRAGLIEIDKQKHILMVDMHHIVSDGTSFGIITGDFMTLYSGKELTPLRVHYKDYCEWQNSDKQKKSLEQQEAFWREKFAGEVPVLDLPTDYPRPAVQSFAGRTLLFEIGPDETAALNRIAFEQGATLYMVLLSIYNILLSKLSGREDIIVGVPTAGRRHADLQGIIGMFINTLCMRHFPAGHKTFRDFLQEVKTGTLEAFENQEYQFEDLVEILRVNRDISRNPLFDAMFALQNIEVADIEIPGLKLGPYGHENRTAKFDMTLQVFEVENRLSCRLEYCTALFKEESILRFIDYYKNIIARISRDMDERIETMDLMSETERRQVLYEFNDIGTPYTRDKTLRELFEEQVMKTPDMPAIVGYPSGQAERVSLTYSRLDEESGQLAQHLTRQGAKANELIAIFVDRSMEMITGILGILKSGCGYVPLNPTAPVERTGYMMQECAVRHLLTTRGLSEEVEKVVNLNFKTTFIDGVNRRVGAQRAVPGSTLNGPPRPGAAGLAYVIFTSGSTGRPKGVPITHANLSPLLHWGYRELGIGAGDRTIQNLSYYFDWSVWEIFITLTTGACLYPVSSGILLNPDASIDFITGNRITVLHVTPTQYRYFADREKRLDTLKYLFIGAEKLDYDLTQRSLTSVAGNCRVFNMYGPTEATIIAAVLEIDRDEYGDFKRLSSVPIGGPVGNTDLYILDRYGMAAPVNVTGELWVAGDGIAAGYLNNPELTNEKFIASGGPPTRVGRRLDHHVARGLGLHGNQSPVPLEDARAACYRTGDLARWLPNGPPAGGPSEATFGGKIEFIGRIDFQVKVRGFRIELGEIESQLSKHDAVKDAVVTVVEYAADDKYICAYIVGRSREKEELAGTPTDSELKQYLSRVLPVYMIPSCFVHVDSIPLTANGKVDRKALPDPGIDRTGGDRILPGDETEKKLARIWSQVLGAGEDVIGIDDNFFDLGGHSLKAAILMSRLSKEFDVKVALGEIFKTPTIRQLAGFFKTATPAAGVHAAIEPAEKKEYYALSSAQTRLFVLQEMERDNVIYNIPAVYVLEGRFDKNKFEKTFNEMIVRHECLRTSFALIAGEPVQKIHDPENIAFNIEYFEASLASGGPPFYKKVGPKTFHEGHSSEIPSPGGVPRSGGVGLEAQPDDLIVSFIRPFDLSEPPLLRAGLIPFEKDKHILMMDMHHVISDGVSSGLFTKEFMALYAGEELPPLRLYYKDYSLWQRSEKVVEAIKEQEEYWLNRFTGEIPVLHLPTDYPRPEVMDFTGSTVDFEVGEIETAALKKIANEHGATLYMIMLTVFNVLLGKLSGQEDIVIGTPIAGRMHTDLERIIGMFVNTLPLRNYPVSDKTFDEFAAEVKERSLKSFENQGYQFEDLVDKAAVRRDVGRNPIFDVMFVFQNIDLHYSDIPEIEIPGLSLKPFEYKNKLSKFDLNITGGEAGEKLLFFVDYCTTLFKKETVERFIDYTGRIISAVTRNSGLKLYEIEILSEEEKQVILYEFNENRTEYPHNKTMRQLFEDQAKKTPDKSAVIGMQHGARGMAQDERADRSRQSVHLTYRKLDRETCTLAGILTGRIVTPEPIVGIMIEPSIEMITGLLAVLKAGGAYLPIDPGYPRERIEYMLADSGTKMVITGNGLFQISETEPDNGNSNIRDNTTANPVLNFGRLNFEFVSSFTSRGSDGASLPAGAGKRQAHPAPAPKGSAAAYIIYTSGSTGRPKGVMVEHRSLINYVWWAKKQYTAGDDLIFPLYTTISFDLTVTSIYLPLISGNAILIYHNDENLSPILQVFKEGIVDVVKATPSHLRLLAEGKNGENSRIKRFIVGGEQFESALARELHTHFSGHIEVYNEYGPTEATVGCMIYTFNYESDREGAVPIGLPIDNSRIYILDEYLKPVPANVAGMLYIGGDTLSRGYINSPELTMKNFLPNPLVPGERIYRTGDLARRLANGSIEFLGRSDEQVKIRGFRIDLDEIANLLSKKEGIKEVAVLDWEKVSGEKSLCAYMITGEEIKAPEMREYLSRKLPDYMIPTYFMRLEEFPLTSNGKLDRKRLPAPTVSIGSDYVVPETEQEKKIADVWTEVLGLEKIGIHNNFFDLGGNSIDIIKLNSRLQEVFARNIPLMNMFRYPTISKFGQYLDREDYSQIIDRDVEKKQGMNRMGKLRKMKRRSRNK